MKKLLELFAVVNWPPTLLISTSKYNKLLVSYFVNLDFTNWLRLINLSEIKPNGEIVKKLEPFKQSIGSVAGSSRIMFSEFRLIESNCELKKLNSQTKQDLKVNDNLKNIKQIHKQMAETFPSSMNLKMFWKRTKVHFTGVTNNLTKRLLSASEQIYEVENSARFLRI
ncbi:hypothetical protein SCLARK_00649 [Spiroplasma clarkii]|uniref:Uncharacterized protein n=1 Tax=Spiroplasma clarkii TaxID=2139 RepID=A0A1Y0KZX5_9MOLU|nr:hypothetical protein [Spiroplasma clarkii]ARU91312.1 hypothetical protein SCLARK_00649 [Spiroplasma clarkii]ATX70738.1 hypothetical protein SCLAR_v1c04140 [Spiroplasma clarkii]